MYGVKKTILTNSNIKTKSNNLDNNLQFTLARKFASYVLYLILANPIFIDVCESEGFKQASLN